jgi:dynein heavy chain
VQVGRGLDKKIEEAISKAVNSGDWLLIENLHLADNWLYELEIIIQKLPYEKVNSKFRLWMSSIQYDNMPAQILR